MRVTMGAFRGGFAGARWTGHTVHAVGHGRGGSRVFRPGHNARAYANPLT